MTALHLASCTIMDEIPLPPPKRCLPRMPAAAACPQAVRDGDILRMWNEDVEGLQTCFAGLFAS